MAETEQCCSSKDQPIDKEQYLKEAEDATNAAKIALDKDDLNAAIEHYATALEKKVAVYGDLAPECAETYYRYGITILERVQLSKDVMGDAVADAADEKAQQEAEEATEEGAEDSGEEDEDEEEGDEEAMDEDAQEGAQEDAEAPAAAPTAADKGKQKVTHDELEGVEDADEDSDEGEEGSEGEEGNEEDDTNVDELQMAWEVLEVAMTIYSKDKEANTKQLSAVHLRLGDVRMENGLTDEALKEYDASLEYSNKLSLETERRARAEIHFRKAIALALADRPLDAQKDFKAAKVLLQAHIEELQSKIENSMDENEKANTQQTIADLQAVVGEISEQELEMVQHAADEKDRRRLVQESMQMIVGVMNELNGEGDATEASADGAGPSGGPTGAPAAKPAGHVKDLGVVGRGKKRITPMPVAGAGEGAAAPAAAPAGNKRSLESLMGGDAPTPGPSDNPFANVKPSATPANLKGSTPLVPVVKKLKIEAEPAPEATATAKGADAPAAANVPAFLMKENVAATYAANANASSASARAETAAPAPAADA